MVQILEPEIKNKLFINFYSDIKCLTETDEKKLNHLH